VGTDERRSFSAIGDAVNTAARLMTVGEPGDVIVGGMTWELLRDPHAGEPLGPVRVKGKRDPIEVWRLRPPT
jgi:adenylate cyclase